MTDSINLPKPGDRSSAAAQLRIVLFVKAFPIRPEAVNVQKFLGLLEQGWDVHIVCNRRVMKEWQLFPQLVGRKDLSRRVHTIVRVRSRLEDVFLFPLTFLRCWLLAPGSTRQYLERGWKRFGPFILHLFIMDAELIILNPVLINYEYGYLALGRMYIKEFLNSRIIVSFQGADLMSTGLDHPDYYRQVWEQADALHLLGEDMWKRAQHRGCPKEKLHALIAPAIDTAYFIPKSKKTPETVGIPTRPFRILSVGRLVWKKGYEVALQAIQQLQDQGIECEFRIIGVGYLEEAIAYTSFDMGLENVVKMLGYRSRSEVKQQLEWADVFFHPAVSEGFCIAVLEAQAMGLPVVCSDAEGLSENVVNGKTGYVVPRRNWQAMAEKLAELAEDARLRQSMGEAGMERVKQNFDASAQIAGFDKLYHRLLA